MTYEPGTKVYVTKYALTTGIVETSVSRQDGRYVWVNWSGALNGNIMFVVDDVRPSEADAQRVVREMCAKKAESLKKQIRKIDSVAANGAKVKR